MEFDPQIRIRPWQTALLASVIVTGLVFVFTPELPMLGASADVPPPVRPTASTVVPTQGSTRAVEDPQEIVPASAPIVRAPSPTGLATDGSLSPLMLAQQREAAELAQRAAQEAEQTEAAASAPFAVRIGSFNVLGSQHTAPGGDRRNFPPASTRSANAAGVISAHGVEILGMQELQDDQLADVQASTGFAAYPGMAWGRAETDNSILYDDERFAFVSGDKFIIPFMGRPRPQPILRLKERATGREFYVVNSHPSAHDGRYLTERRHGQDVLVDIVNQLKASGLPVLVTGDMNDREEFYCRVVPRAGLVASNGGSYTSGCTPPPSPIAVDWVVGGGGVSFSDYWRDTTPVTRKISDHFFISATAHVG
ncbi:MAG: endonuclease/exonuclease/phosphatase family protein [Nocardioides sp.]